MKKLVPLVALLLFFTACSKKPKAGFSLDKPQYSAGETIYATNDSEDAYKYEWVLYDPVNMYGVGDMQTGKNASFKLNVLQTDASWAILLRAYSKNGKKKDEKTIAFDVKTSWGYVKVIGHDVNHFFQAYVDGEFCGNSLNGELLIKAPVGSRQLRVTDNIQTWELNHTVATMPTYVWVLP